MRDLDEKDREILQILSREARIATKALAGRIALSRSATAERIANLERAGIIRGYRADIGEIDGSTIRALLLIKLKRTPSHDLLDVLAQSPQVRRVLSVAGDLDLVAEIVAGNMEKLNALRDIIAGHDAVADITTSVVLRREIDRENG
ncbi:Lrp/AsnC family transcriptional regulator [Gemmobacter denitrificans]|uniref:Lrp/AsnC family transcriptional regulator n=1 Tax=Gemmobacter denitrificans TaxID=3123040 RepID=A0ABU8BSI3_9RHOB